MALFAGQSSSSGRRSDKPPLPSQRDLYLACLRPGNNLDIVTKRDDDTEMVESHGSMLHDITRDRKLILAQTSPPLGVSRVGSTLEITFLVRLDDVPGGRLLRVGYSTPLLSVVPNYRLGGSITEPVLIVDVPPRLDETSLRMHFRVVPPLEMGLRAYIGAATLRKIVEEESVKFDHLFRSELWNRERHPKLQLRDLTDALKMALDTVASRVEDVRQSEVADISEGGVRLVHPSTWSLQSEEKVDLTLVWGDDILDLDAMVVRGGDMESRGGRPRKFSCLRFGYQPLDIRRKLSKLVNDMLRKELAKRAEMED
jgi:hypothetical protein